MQTILDVNHVGKSFTIDGSENQILGDIDLHVERGEFVSIVGKSGCGKSTLLRIIGGLEHASKGNVLIDGIDVVEPVDKCKMIFQEARLFSWMTVTQNIEFGLDKRVKKNKELVREYIELIGLTGYENAYPKQLSGGMQQRVSLARSLICKPDLLLLDEPFGALDAFTRINMQNEILRIREKQKTTMILVTHDIDEAIFLSDRIIILSDHPGKIEDTIKVDLYRPRNRSQSEFMDIRRRVLGHFLDETDVNIEYYI